MENLEERIKRWRGECMRKKRLRKEWADNIIERAAKQGNELRKYYCPHCQHWHVSSMLNYKR